MIGQGSKSLGTDTPKAQCALTTPPIRAPTADVTSLRRGNVHRLLLLVYQCRWIDQELFPGMWEQTFSPGPALLRCGTHGASSAFPSVGFGEVGCELAQEGEAPKCKNVSRFGSS